MKKIEDCDRTTIDETNQTINLDQQDTGVSVVEFPTALQANTKQMPKKFLTLVDVQTSSVFTGEHIRKTD